MTRYILYCLLLLLPLGALHAATNTPNAIPWNQIGAKAGADYRGDGLTVTPTPSGAQLHCVFQRLDGEATPEGLWLTSTITNTTPDRFRVTAVAIERRSIQGTSGDFTGAVGTNRKLPQLLPLPKGEGRGEGENGSRDASTDNSTISLSTTGSISISAQTVRYTRPNLTEEYTVSMDGLRQDFIVEQPPAGREASWTAAAPSLPYPHLLF